MDFKTMWQTLKRNIKVWWSFALLGFIFIAVFSLLYLNDYEKEKTISVNIINFIDVSASVCLFILAVVAYYKYASDKRREIKWLQDLEDIHSKSKNSNCKDGAIVIQVGGSNPNAISEAKRFFDSELKIQNELIVSKKFGDEKNKITIEDVEKVQSWLKEECMLKLTYVSNIHIVVIGVGVIFAVVADTLNNWKTLIFYHNDNNSNGYKAWYHDIKSSVKCNAKNPLKEHVNA